MPAHPLYMTWYNMIRRCTEDESADPQWENYGGRGIRVCDQWFDLEVFVQDMGDRPDGFTLDRIDPDGDYEPSNCRWASPREQTLNRAATRYITNKETGETLCVSDWARRLGMSRSQVTKRLSRGWPEQEAITRLPRSYGGYHSSTPTVSDRDL